jgi:CubicO group peptidase (beta-lactamase class C family)
MAYFPESNWQSISTEKAGFSEGLAQAITAAESLEIDAPVNLAEMLPKGKRHPNDRPLGPLKPRGKPSGIVIRYGYIVASYGDVNSVEVTFSATKSYISAVAGLAWSRGLITDLDQRVSATVTDGGFDSAQNASITWRHLLQQTSEWEGELFGLPDWIDRGRQVGSSATMNSRTSARTSTNPTVGGSASSANDYRALQTPGTFWEYNDVRVNRTSLALLRRFEEPLPVVIKNNLMDRINSTETWQWHGYEASWVDIDGQQVQSVSGGAHWGGGLWINTLDHARFGLLYLNQGQWAGQEILSQEWIAESLRPCDMNPGYGFLWWLNHEDSISTIADTGAFAARGAGGNIVFVWPAREIVIVLRWCAESKKAIDGILGCLI